MVDRISYHRFEFKDHTVDFYVGTFDPNTWPNLEQAEDHTWVRLNSMPWVKCQTVTARSIMSSEKSLKKLLYGPDV